MAKNRANGEGTIRKRADGRWEARYTDTRETDPKKRRKFIYGKSQRAVVERLKEALAEVSGNVPLLSNDNPAVSEWLPFWLKEYKITELRDGTYERYSGIISWYIIPMLGEITLKELTGVQIQQMFNKLLETKSTGGWGLSSATVIKVKNVLSGALQQAVINKIIKHNPLAEVNPPKLVESSIRILSKEEQKQFIGVLPFFNTGNMFAVSLATGMRIGELCALDIRDINREQKYIDITKTAGRRKDKYTGEVSIKVGPTKTKNSVRRIPLLPSVEIMFDRQAMLVAEMRVCAGDKWNENTLVFPTDEGNIHSITGLHTSLDRILKRAELPHITIHALRHTYATTALNAGIAAQNVARLLGHKDGATTLRIYAHYLNIEAIGQMERLEQQNISHLGITASELERIMMGTAKTLEKAGVSEMINSTITKVKNLPIKKSVEMVLSVCEDILCRPLDDLSADDREVLLGTLAKYTLMKREYASREKLEIDKDRELRVR